MNRELLILLTLSLIALIAVLRLLWNAHRARRAANAYPRWWRTTLLALLQATLGIALYLTLFPPERSAPVAELVVYTGDATATDAPNAIALPEAPEHIDAPRVPDLATALRQHPGTRRIRVLGSGLPARDQDAARHLAIHFSPSPQPRGVVELEAPYWVAAGQSWQVRGSVTSLAGGTVALVDPAGSALASATIPPDGRFELRANSRGAGRALFTLNVMDQTQTPFQQLTVPLVTLPSDPLRVAIIAGGINPEFKYLRRWAVDAGLRLGSRLTMSRNSDLISQPVTLSPSALAEWDLLVLDDRAWYRLRDSERAAIQDAVRGGLGLLLRMTGEPSARERSLLAALEFEVDSVQTTRGVRLPPIAAPDHLAADESTADRHNPELSRRALRVAGPHTQVLLRSAGNDALAAWRPLGRGRVALWWLTDTYRLVLAGQGFRHADIWSHAVQRIARARGDDSPQFRERHAWVDQRVVICASGDMQVLAPDGGKIPLIADPASDPGCAGYWPQQAGWHALDIDGKQWPFFVRDTGQDMALMGARIRADTAQLANDTPATAPALTSTQPLPRWQPFSFWLLLTSLLWMLERSRLGIARD